jgi:hypothetical protein
MHSPDIPYRMKIKFGNRYRWPVSLILRPLYIKRPTYWVWNRVVWTWWRRPRSARIEAFSPNPQSFTSLSYPGSFSRPDLARTLSACGKETKRLVCTMGLKFLHVPALGCCSIWETLSRINFNRDDISLEILSWRLCESIGWTAHCLIRA